MLLLEFEERYGKTAHSMDTIKHQLAICSIFVQCSNTCDPIKNAPYRDVSLVVQMNTTLRLLLPWIKLDALCLCRLALHISLALVILAADTVHGVDAFFL
jgi:hypothetical protein